MARLVRHHLQKGPLEPNCNNELLDEPAPPSPNLDPYGDGDEEVQAWLATFAAWPRKKKKLAYSTFLKLTAIGEILNL
jgi:hypothetical protein